MLSLRGLSKVCRAHTSGHTGVVCTRRGIGARIQPAINGTLTFCIHDTSLVLRSISKPMSPGAALQFTRSGLRLAPHRARNGLVSRFCVPRLQQLGRTRLNASSDEAGPLSGGYASDDMPPEQLHQALGEAVELFGQANQMSSLQVHAELEQAFAADTPSSSDTADASCPPGAMLNFWIEQGLSADTANALLQELQASGRTYSMNQLSAKVQRLRRVLPDADIASWASRDSRLLDVDMNMALLNMICLVEAFPGRDIMLLLARQPRLLWCDDLRDRVARVCHKLQDLHPSKDLTVVREIVAENPELLFRMDYYMDAMLIDYLPIEIQNMMVLTGQGIGFLYRYYNNARTNYQAEISRHEFPMSD